jgi:hypothetical protein
MNYLLATAAFLLVFSVFLMLCTFSSHDFKSDRQPSRTSEFFVTPELKGRCGNQLFEIANAFSYSKYSGKTLSIEKHKATYFDNIFSKVPGLNFKQKSYETYSEDGFHYTKIPFLTGNIRLEGYFQSEKYINPFKTEFCQLIEDGMTSSGKVKDIHDTLLNLSDVTCDATVALHIRRGDYLDLDLHLSQPLSYYKQAFNVIQGEVGAEKRLQIFVFSDDISWCEKNIDNKSFKAVITFVKTNLKDYQELFMMSLLDHQIIANSSFSWWSAYLNKNPGKIVIAPKMWFKSSVINWNDLYCEGWRIL